jgi:hypothetical protein
MKANGKFKSETVLENKISIPHSRVKIRKGKHLTAAEEKRLQKKLPSIVASMLKGRTPADYIRQMRGHTI